MRIGVPKEIKNNEFRVGMVPSSVLELVHFGHEVFVETGAGTGSGFEDSQYTAVGAKILNTAKEIFDQTDMIVKVKEPQIHECAMLHEGQILFTYLHLAPDPEQTEALIQSKAIAIAYETVTDHFGRLPLLAPMSEVAGRMSIQVGARALEKEAGGAGVLLGGVPGVAAGRVTILGGGVVGTNAARMAIGLEAEVIIIDSSLHRLRQLDDLFGSRIKTVVPNRFTLEHYATTSDLVVGAVLLPGAAAPKLITKEIIAKMRPGSVVVDVAIDQGGCFETSRPTTHAEPTYVVDGVVHYCVTNMPGAVPRTSACALNNATLPYIVALANKGYKNALSEDAHLMNGLNVCGGHVTYKAVADALNLKYVPGQDALNLQ
ncbi:MAG: alanine dehydrogenase [Alphaproteobacteria bacterium]|nr:alanine dehydrogenase [Alphaproteobacteria bacterium]